jgi:hypothetical protein
VLQHDVEFAVGSCFELNDALDVDDGGSMDADEAHGVEAPDELMERRAIQQLLAGDMQAHVHACRLDAVDIRDAHEARGAAGFHDEPIEQARRSRRTRRQAQHLLTELVGAALAQPLPGPNHRGFLAFIAVGLQQVVERIRFEGENRVSIVRGDEYGQRHLRGTDGVDDTEAVELRHLDIQEHQIRPPAGNLRDGIEPVRGLYDVADTRILSKEIDQPLPRRLLVVHDEHAKTIMRGRHHAPRRPRRATAARSRLPCRLRRGAAPRTDRLRSGRDRRCGRA